MTETDKPLAGSECEIDEKSTSELEVVSPPIERVGYGRPPVTTRFRPGQSGNPRGRPKGARNLSTIVASALGERVVVTENGRRRHITKIEAAIKQLVNRAASGETRATQLLLALVQSQEAKQASAPPERPSEADAIVMAELARRFAAGGEP